MKLYEEDGGAASFALACVLWPLLIVYFAGADMLPLRQRFEVY